MSYRIMFLREKYYMDHQLNRVVPGNPIGCIAIKLHKNGRTAEYQVSTLNPMDRFDRAVARQLALGRLTENPLTVQVKASSTLENITRAVMLDIAVDTNATSRARKAAKLWLKWNV